MKKVTQQTLFAFTAALLLAPLAPLHAKRNLPGVPRFRKLLACFFQALENHSTQTSNA